MQRSTNRTLTTHGGSLIHPLNILKGMMARVLAEPVDDFRFQRDVRQGVADIVARQAEISIDIPSDCGFSPGWNMARVHSEVQWVKPSTLVEGAALASRQLWH